ncbi:hypothetical protein C8Q80DRAFT_737766 [Daedaleopsis nitida]|nr:hypothetical protein C8Q80DRAFT_737766 [Daedaleopsis nitida]
MILVSPPQLPPSQTIAMEKLAVELLTLISFYACTDGGRTGRSLALVSKRINYASRPARFYSVSLIESATQIEQFLACYEAECARAEDNLPRVRHLCLSFFGKALETAPPEQVPAHSPSSSPNSRAAFFASLQRRTQHWRNTQNNLDEQYNRVIPALVRAVAPDLYSLALVQAQWRSATVIRCQFPRLEELTLVGGDPSFLPFSFAPAGKPIYPALKRLHHICALVNKDIDFLQWAEHAPSLTHLRVSRMDYYPRVTVDTLEQVMSPSAPSNVFPHLEQVVVQPHPGPPPNPDGRPSTMALSYRDFLAHLRKSARKARVPVVLLPAMEAPNPAQGVDPSRGCILRLRGVWMNRIEGGPGVWDNRAIREEKTDSPSPSASASPSPTPPSPPLLPSRRW